MGPITHVASASILYFALDINGSTTSPERKRRLTERFHRAVTITFDSPPTLACEFSTYVWGKLTRAPQRKYSHANRRNSTQIVENGPIPFPTNKPPKGPKTSAPALIGNKFRETGPSFALSSRKQTRQSDLFSLIYNISFGAPYE